MKDTSLKQLQVYIKNLIVLYSRLLLFMIMINDLVDKVKYSKISLFADDFKVYKAINDYIDYLKLFLFFRWTWVFILIIRSLLRNILNIFEIKFQKIWVRSKIQ